MASLSMEGGPARIPVGMRLWLALGVFIIYPFIKLLLATFDVDGNFSAANLVAVFSNTYDQMAFVNHMHQKVDDHIEDMDDYHKVMNTLWKVFCTGGWSEADSGY